MSTTFRGDVHNTDPSLAETLDGEVNVAMLVYQSGEAAIQLFSGDSPQAQKILGAALPALATNGDYKVTNHSAASGHVTAALTLIGWQVQQELAKPGQVERFLGDSVQIDAVRHIFTGLYSLDCVGFVT